MKTICHSATLFYYDGVQVFEAVDSIGGHYIAIMVEPVDGTDRYLIVGIEPERLRKFRGGLLDLRTLIIERSTNEWYLATPTNGLEHPISLEPQSEELAQFAQLPDAGFFLHNQQSSDEALQEAKTRNNLIFEIAVEPPEAIEHRIHLGTLGELLVNMQKMMKHAYGTALRKLPPSSRQNIGAPDENLFDVVVPATTGSFRFILEATNKSDDLFGHNHLSLALSQLDELFKNAGDPEVTVDFVNSNRGHLAKSYLRLLQFLELNQTGLRYAWAEPSFEKTKSFAVLEAQVGPLVRALTKISEIGSEAIVVVGILDKVHDSRRAWSIIDDEGKSVSGEVKEGGPSLAGLTIKDRYKFTCVEEITETPIGTREQRQIFLISNPERV